ncbi:hypothetical protein [Oceanisphaera pacifica]|uniref:Uncharacterized protein n=1 Tax=Oceanisphaera pacifica TaxID=2818389 RepID=A0ABS3NE33_9GAMM|nr:hypothetical protein [Oceanisphaera pacifica]MBO1518550.1 hypothetical protein [Oceanisphaera pacifica]
MTKILGVQLQGIQYHWNGQDILVDDGVGVPWPLIGSLLDQIELLDAEGEPVATFSIDFLAQQWLVTGDSSQQHIILIDDSGSQFPLYSQDNISEDEQLIALLSSDSGALLGASEVEVQSMPRVTDILQDADQLLEGTVTPLADTTSLNRESIDDVLNWFAVYHHHD